MSILLMVWKGGKSHSAQGFVKDGDAPVLRQAASHCSKKADAFAPSIRRLMASITRQWTEPLRS
jgi:hypothetical protein